MSVPPQPVPHEPRMPKALEPISTWTAWARELPAVAVLMAVFLAVAVFVDPLREALTEDDAWLYAQTAQRLVNEGSYRLHSYATANMPVQIFWAAALSKVLGYSLVTLRLSTLLLSCLGLLAFYGLVRDLALPRARAVGLALVYLCNPYGLIFSYSFMTDVQFVSWLVIALFFYARGLRSGHVGTLLVGSLAAAAAIGTRQFGVMLIAGMVLCWATDTQRRQRVGLYAAGLVVPVGAAIWQGISFLYHPTWMQSVMHLWQADVWRQGPRRLLGESIWRPVVILQYATLLVVPLWPLVIGLGRRSWLRVDEPQLARFGRLILIAAVVGLAILYCDWSTESALGDVVRRIPFPSIPWFLQFYLRARDLPFGSAWAALTALAVIWALWLLVRFFVLRELRWAIPSADRLPLYTGLCLLVGHVTFPTIIDTYALPFVPLLLLVLGRELRDLPWPRPLLWACCAVWLCTLVYTACWLRGKLERYDAVFTLAGRIQASGVPAREISAGYHWDGYHGAFDDWLAQSDARENPRAYAGPHRIDKAYHRFVAERYRVAAYRVGADEADPREPGWRVVDRVAYRDARLRLRYMLALQRTVP